MTVRYSIADGVAVAEIDRPDVRNAIDLATLAALDQAIDSAVADGARALVLAGRGPAFCAGADLGLVRQAFAGDAPSVLGPLVDTLHALIRRVRSLPMPVVAGLEGPAVGAGMGLALAADVRVAARSALLVPGYFGIGSSPDGGVSYFLTRALGAARATALTIRNRPLRADDMLAAGLVEEVVDDGKAVDAAKDLAAELAASTPPLALVRLRALVDEATVRNLDAQLDAERQGVAELWPSADFREGVGAFLERRRPSFSGT